MRARVRRFRGLRRAVVQPRKAEGVEVSIRQRVVQSQTVRQMPWAIGTARGAGQLRIDAPTDKLRLPGAATFPLLPDYGSQTVPDPVIQ